MNTEIYLAKRGPEAEILITWFLFKRRYFIP